MRSLAFACAFLLLAALPAPVRAMERDLPLSAFFGFWTGTGEASDTEELGEIAEPRPRHSNVSIAKEGKNGFSVTWTTLISAPGDEAPKSKSDTRTFVPTENVHYFKELLPADAEAKGITSWAHLKGDSLYVNQLAMGQDGSFDLTSYERRIVSDGLMEVVFTRIHNGELVRRAVLTLSRGG